MSKKKGIAILLSISKRAGGIVTARLIVEPRENTNKRK